MFRCYFPSSPWVTSLRGSSVVQTALPSFCFTTIAGSLSRFVRRPFLYRTALGRFPHTLWLIGPVTALPCAILFPWNGCVRFLHPLPLSHRAKTWSSCCPHYCWAPCLITSPWTWTTRMMTTGLVSLWEMSQTTNVHTYFLVQTLTCSICIKPLLYKGTKLQHFAS